MPAKNLIANLFSTIINAEKRNLKECLVIPSSNLAVQVVRTIQKGRYIGEFEVIDDGLGGKLRVQLMGRINGCRSVNPRFSVRKDGYGRWERQFLPAVGVGILIVSTSKGVVSHTEAHEMNVGGRLVGYIY